jgi:hypothetical protein
MEQTNRNVLQDQTAWQIIHTRSVDANSHQGTLGLLYCNMEATQLGTTWHQWSHLNGTTEERNCNKAVAVYQSTIGKVSPTDGVVLHHARIEEILKWTKEHLDAYLASADVIIDQRDEPG